MCVVCVNCLFLVDLIDPSQQLGIHNVGVGMGGAPPPSNLPVMVSNVSNSSGHGSGLVATVTSAPPPNHPSPTPAPKKTEGKNTASFDYLVTLLSPQYPNYTRYM